MANHIDFRNARVLVVSPIDGGSLPISRHVAEAFEALGVEVRFLDFAWLAAPPGWQAAASSDEARGRLIDYASQLVLAEVEAFQPELCFALAQAPLKKETLAAIRRRGTKTAFWFVENYRLTRYWEWLAPHYDWFFTAQRGRFHELLRQVGCHHVGWLPLACNPKRHRRVRLSQKSKALYGSDVSLAGYGYYNRREFLGGLSDFDLKVWGTGWEGSALEALVQKEGRPFDERELVRIASAAKIHLNLHSASHVAGVDPEGDYLNPRLFELAACGAFQIADERSDLPELFRLEDEIPVFDDIGSLRRQIEHYLCRPSDRRRIARAARKRALAEHTYQKRMEVVLSLTMRDTEKAHKDDRADASIDLADFPRISGRTFRRPEDFSMLLDELSHEPRVSDDEALLRLALKAEERRP